MGRDTEGEGPRAKLAYGFITLSSLLAHVLIVSIINSKKKNKMENKNTAWAPGPPSTATARTGKGSPHSVPLSLRGNAHFSVESGNRCRFNHLRRSMI